MPVLKCRIPTIARGPWLHHQETIRAFAMYDNHGSCSKADCTGSTPLSCTAVCLVLRALNWLVSTLTPAAGEGSAILVLFMGMMTSSAKHLLIMHAYQTCVSRSLVERIVDIGAGSSTQRAEEVMEKSDHDGLVACSYVVYIKLAVASLCEICVGMCFTPPLNNCHMYNAAYAGRTLRE